MAHTVKIGSLNKRLNSTKQPDSSEWAEYGCVFKDETSIYQPTIRLSTDFATFSANHYNYAVMLGRYYWIRDIRSIRTGVIEIDMIIDPLANLKTAILNTSAFIEYGFNSFDASDDAYRFVDSRIPISENPTMYNNFVDPSGGIISPTAGCYIVQAVGNNPSGRHKGLATFALTSAQLAQLLTAINTTIANQIDAYMASSTLNAQQVMNELTAFSLKQELLNESAMAAIQSVRWLPLDIVQAVGVNTDLYLGNFNTNITPQPLMLDANVIYHSTTTLTIPWPVSDWKRNNCQLLLYLPFFGTVPVPTDQCINTDNISIYWTAEYFSGSISVKIDAGQYTLYTGSNNISVDMGIGRSQVGASQAIGGAVQALGGVMEMAGGALDIGAGAVGSFLGIGGGNIAGAMSSIAGGAQNVVSGYAQTVQPVITCAGTMGGMAAIGQIQLARIILLYYPPIDEAGFAAKYGHPVFRVSTPAAGFCKTRGFSVSVGGNSLYSGMVNAAMDGGVFIE